MDGAGDEFLAGAALAGDHHRRVAVRDAADHLEDLLHRGGLADDAVLMLLDGELRLEGRGRAHLGLRLERGIDDDLEVERQRLLPDEVEGAELHRLDHRLRGAERADQDHDRVRIALPDFREQLQPAERREMRLGDEQIGLFAAENLEAPRPPWWR